jgi:hypothetical protein
MAGTIRDPILNCPIDIAVYGPATALGRYLAALVVRLMDGTVKQATGILARLNLPAPANSPAPPPLWVILFPAHVVREGLRDLGLSRSGEQGPAIVRDILVGGAKADGSIGIVWHITAKGGLQQGQHYVFCPKYKSNVRHCKERDWAAVRVDPNGQSLQMQVTMPDGTVAEARYAMVAPGGFSSFPWSTPQLTPQWGPPRATSGSPGSQKLS